MDKEGPASPSHCVVWESCLIHKSVRLKRICIQGVRSRWWMTLCVSRVGLNRLDRLRSPLSGCMTASFCPQTKGPDPHQSVLIRAARRQTIPLHNSNNSCSLALLRARHGVSPTPGVPQKGTFSLGDWQPSVHTTRGPQVLKDLSAHGAAHRRLQLCAA